MPTERLRPSSDISAGGWTPSTGVALWPLVSDDPPSDSRFISWSSGGLCQVTLSALLGTGVSSAVLFVRLSSGNPGTSPAQPMIDLMEGATIRASFQPSYLGSGWGQQSYTLTGAELSSISSWSNLRIRIAGQWGEGSLDPGSPIRIGEVWLEVVTAAGGAISLLPLLGAG